MLLALVWIASGAQAACTDVPKEVADYLARHPGWRIVQVNDLSRDDQRLWSRYESGSCPGLAEVDFDGSGRPFHSLGLLSGNKKTQKQKIVAFRHTGSGFEEHELHGPFAGLNPVVIRRVPPGPAKDRDSHSIVHVEHDSLEITQLEASSHLVYLNHGRFLTIWTSD